MSVDKSWIYLRNKYDSKYVGGAVSFWEMTKEMVDNDGKIYCPCKKCVNFNKIVHADVLQHILKWGFLSTYNVWVYHGENMPNTVTGAPVEVETNADVDDIGGLLNDAFAHSTDDNFGREGDDLEVGDEEEIPPNEEPWSGDVDKLFADMTKELYPGCKDFSVLSLVVHLMHTKVNNKWTNASFDVLMGLMCKLFKDANLPQTYYKSKCYLRALGLGYESIHACVNYCVLFWKEKKDLEECPVCRTSRWMNANTPTKKIPQKVLRYFPITPRLKRMFSSRHTASNMTWHETKRDKTPGVLRHPADGEAWKHFDATYPDFAAEPRNLRLGLATDGFNPFGTMSNSYSMWPVLLFPYNMAPWDCMSDPSFLMPLLIPGRKSPGKDIDVYMQPLIQELKQLWITGVDTFDVAQNNIFRLRACLLWTVHDFPAYGYVSGWSTSGYKACPTCNDDTTSIRITDKQSYGGHRRFLPIGHSWRRNKKFNGKTELRPPPKKLTGEEIIRQLRNLPKVPLGKGSVKRKRGSEVGNWTKKSILFQLPYWSKLLLRHNIDIMHVEKNIFDNIFATLLDLAGSKDNDKSRDDLRNMGIRKELWLKKQNNRTVRPRAAYVLPLQERREFCKFLKAVKYPDGVASNISANVNEETEKVLSLKTHDCHMLLQRILPIGIRKFVTKEIAEVIVELGYFFKKLTARTLFVTDLEKMKEDIVCILCKLEAIYPPSFLTIMIHLSVHLPEEALLGGPVPYRWMFKVERTLGRLKKFVRNRARPEGSIAEGYCVNEALDFCSRYLAGDVITAHNRPERYFEIAQPTQYKLSMFNSVGRVLGRKQLVTLSADVLEKARWYCLNNCPEIQPFLDEHKEILIQQGISPTQILIRHEKDFPAWFEKRIVNLWMSNRAQVSDELYALANGPDQFQFSYPGCVMNGIKYLVKSRDDRRKTQNSGIHVPGIQGEVENDYFGVLDQVIEIQFFNKYRVLLMKYKWYDTRRERNHVSYDKHFISVDTRFEWFKEDPFIFASQAKQVYYIQDPTKSSSWYVIESFAHRHVWDIHEADVTSHICEDQSSYDVGVNQDFDVDNLRTNRGEETDDASISSGKQRIQPQQVVVEDDDTDIDDTLQEYDDEPMLSDNEDDDDDDEQETSLDVDLSDDDDE